MENNLLNISSTEGMYLEFNIAQNTYILEVKFVTEIVITHDITELPKVPHYVKGVVNLRGKVIPVIDVRILFNYQFKEYDERTCIIVTHFEGKDTGFIVDNVREVVTISKDMIEDPPRIKTEKSGEFILGLAKLEKDVDILLDLKKMVNSRSTIDLQKLEKIQEQ